MAGKHTIEPAQATQVVDGGWPLEPKERRDFYHRVRAWPPEVAAWRKQFVSEIIKRRDLYPSVPKDADEVSVRAMVDEGVARIRELARILQLVTKTTLPQRVPAPDREFALDVDLVRVLTRIGLYEELGLKLQELTPANKKGLLPGLIPPILRPALRRSLKVLAKTTCTTRAPKCDTCEVGPLCRTDRNARASAAASSSSPTFIDLFCGAGGLTEGFKRAGYRPLAALDNDALSLRTYRYNHPEVPDENVLQADIREVSTAQLKKLAGKGLDVLIGAPPCQGFSSAGFRSKRTQNGYRETRDARNFLFQEMLRIAGALKPRLILLENVPGMKSAKSQNTSFIDAAAQELERRWNYRTAIWRLNASAFGVPQDRIRVFLVASRIGDVPPRPGEEYQDMHSPNFDIDALPPVTLTDAIFDLPPRSPDSGEGAERLTEPPNLDDKRFRRYLSKNNLLSKSALIFNHTVRFHNDRDLELYDLLEPGEDSVHILEKHGRTDLMRYRRDVFDDKYARLRPDRPSKTIVSHLAKDGNGYIHPIQVRSISLREGARVQSFRDGYAFCGSPSNQWVQVGNAVPPLLAQAIATSFSACLTDGA